MVDTQKLLRSVRAFMRDNYPGCKPVELSIRIATGEKVRIPVLGKRRKDSRVIEAALERDPDAMADAIKKLDGNKKKILDAMPGKDDPAISQKQVFSKAKVSASDWNRNKLEELIDEGEVVRTSKGYRKGK